ncbi:hypothetical protein [Synechococcus sp. UW179A]|uniref:hypothetical protein n=1 Tax=Synechococcus sp. UW179A TaxID=2575510 RepID=UPI0010BE2C98|nr:hypothetical protein [Synechococcus sp. UW179A]
MWIAIALAYSDSMGVRLRQPFRHQCLLADGHTAVVVPGLLGHLIEKKKKGCSTNRKQQDQNIHL